MRRDGVFLEERLALAVPEAEEEHVDLVERHGGGEPQVALAIEPFVDVGNQIAGVALAIDELNLGAGMVHEQPNEFACRVSRAAKNADFNHKSAVVVTSATV